VGNTPAVLSEQIAISRVAFRVVALLAALARMTTRNDRYLLIITVTYQRVITRSSEFITH